MSDRVEQQFSQLRRGPWYSDPLGIPQEGFGGNGNIESQGWIADDAITADTIQANAVIAGKIDADAVTAREIAANTITANEIAANTITAAQIAANTITASEIAANAITASELAANSVVSGKIAANTITATEIAANAITANEIAANAITASELAANSVITEKILAGNVVSSKIELTVSGKNFGANPGTASAPGVYFDSDSDTGMYLGGAGNIVIVSSSGNTSFSIGTSSNISKNPLYPALDNVYPLGTSILRWSEVFAANGTINTSDERLKTDIEDSPLGLSFVRSLRPRSYRWRDTPDAPQAIEEEALAASRAPLVAEIEAVRRRQLFGEISDAAGNAEVDRLRQQLRALRPAAHVPSRRPGRRRHFGLIAQEVKRALDDAGQDAAFWRQESDGGLQSLNYSELLAPLIAAVQELDAELQELKQSLNERNDE